MTRDQLQRRQDVAPQNTWNKESVFPTIESWESECTGISAELGGQQDLKESLAEGPEQLADALEAIYHFRQRVDKLLVFAQLDFSVDTEQ